MTYRDVVLADSPIEYYELNETSGTSAASSGSGAHAATHSGGVTLGVAGVVNTAASYDGIDDLTTTPTTVTDFMAGTAFSTEMWVKYDGTYSNDYPTFIRRDGNSKTFLVRTRNPSQGRGHIIEAYYNGRTVDTSATTFNDNKWHHVVVTVSSTTVRLFVDNVEYTNSNGTAVTGAAGSVPAYIGRGLGAGEYFKGQIDEVAIYNKALTTTAIGNHYNAVPVSVSIDQTTATASLQSPDATIETHGKITQTTGDSYVTDGTEPISAPTSETMKVVNSSSGSRTSVSTVQFGNCAPVYSTIVKATMRVKVYSNTGAAIGQYIHAETGGVSSPNITTWGLAAGNIVEFDVTDALAAVFDGGGNSPTFLIASDSPSTNILFQTSESNVIGHLVPEIEVFYVPHTPVAISLGTATATVQSIEATAGTMVTLDLTTSSVSVASNDVTVSAIGNVSFDADTANASVVAPDPTVSTILDPNATVDVETVSMTTSANDVSITLPTTVDLTVADSVTFSAEDVTVEQTQNADISLDTPVIIQTLIGLTDVNGEPIVGSETDDRYFVATSQSSPSIWFRLNEKSGTEVIDRVSQQPAGDYHGVTIGMYNAPEGRQSVYFNGSAYISQREPTGSNQDEQFGTPRTLEFNMRTDKQSQFIAGGVDLSAPSKPEFSPGTTYPYEFWLKDGKINYRHWTMNSSTGVMTQTDNIVAFTNIADGKWHNIVITAGGYNSARSASYMDIYIDGKLEIRRFISGIFGFPDFIGGRPEAYRGYPSGAPALPGVTEWFVGDMTEISLRNNVLLSQDQISLQRDTFFGVYPIYTETPTITSTSYEASIKGNKPRVLILEFGPHTATGGESLTYLPTGNTASYITEVGGSITVNYPGLQSQFGSGDDNSTELYQFFTVPTRGSNYQYTDEVTGNERLIDLDKDINLDDFDILAINNYPQTGAEREFWYDNADTASVAPYIPMRVQLENLMAQIRQKVIEGKRLFVNDPASAVALGIISNFDMVPTMEEQFIDDKRIGSFTDIYDYHAAKIDPWGNPQHTDETALDHASRYQDTHNNTFQRVHTLVPGLTDIPSWIIEDRVAWYNVDPLGNPPAHESMKVVERADGLAVGDEFYMLGAHGPSFMDWFYDYGISGPRVNGWPAAKVSDVQVGTVVTTFGNKLYNFNATPTNQDDDFDTVVDNPYNTYAVSVVVEPGTVWDGQEVVGKVYMNFTEGFTNWATFIETMSLNIYNESGKVGSIQYLTTEEQREWRYSTHAGNYSGTDIIVPVLFISNFYVDNSGRIRKTNKDAHGGKDSGMITVYNWAPVFPQEVVDVLNMANRGLMWLVEDISRDGDVLVAADTLKVNVETTAATVSASVNETVDLSTARVNTSAIEMSDVVPADATVLAGTPTLTIRTVPFVENVDVSTAQITVNIVEPESDLLNNVDMITLVLPAHSITLQMEDN